MRLYIIRRNIDLDEAVWRHLRRGMHAKDIALGSSYFTRLLIE